MKFYERVISDFGGYEKCKDILSQPNIDFIMNAQGLREHMLEYRRQHNIFEVGDKVVSKYENLNLFGDVVLEVEYFRKLSSVVWVRFTNGNDYRVDALRHATDAEIAAGRRL